MDSTLYWASAPCQCLIEGGAQPWIPESGLGKVSIGTGAQSRDRVDLGGRVAWGQIKRGRQASLPRNVEVGQSGLCPLPQQLH